MKSQSSNLNRACRSAGWLGSGGGAGGGGGGGDGGGGATVRCSNSGSSEASCCGLRLKSLKESGGQPNFAQSLNEAYLPLKALPRRTSPQLM